MWLAMMRWLSAPERESCAGWIGGKGKEKIAVVNTKWQIKSFAHGLINHWFFYPSTNYDLGRFSVNTGH